MLHTIEDLRGRPKGPQNMFTVNSVLGVRHAVSIKMYMGQVTLTVRIVKLFIQRNYLILNSRNSKTRPSGLCR